MTDQKSGKYTSPYSPEDVGEGMTPTGFTSRQLYSMEEAAQRKVAENTKWLLARRVNTFSRDEDRDSKSGLEKLGFKVLREVDDLFYEVNPPEGWTKETSGYWTYVRDDQGNERISMFYKGAIYDRDAFLNFSKT